MSNTLPAVQAPEMAQSSPAPSDEPRSRRRGGSAERGARFAAWDTTLIAALMTALVTMMIFGYTRLGDDIDRIEDQVDAKFDKVDARFVALEEDIDARFDKVDARFVALEEDIDAQFVALEEDIDARFDKVDARLDEMGARMGRLETQIAVLSAFLGVPGTDASISDTAPTAPTTVPSACCLGPASNNSPTGRS